MSEQQHRGVEFRPEDEGTRVVTPDGTVLGVIESVDAGTAYLRPREGLLTGCGAWLTDARSAETLYPLDGDVVRRLGESVVEIRPDVCPAALTVSG